jgi:RimJ/RimL family protein N-acetyltransferase
VEADLAHRREGYAAHATADLAGSMGGVSEDFILTGERAALGPLKRDHLPMFARWINDPEVRRGLAHRGLANEDAELKWYEQMTEAGRAPRPAAVTFAVHDAADGELVGVCGIEGIDYHFARAELGMFIGRRRGAGIGTDATRLALDWAFNMLGLRNVMLETYEFNEQARRAYERAGFRVIGRRRDAVSVLGRRWDSLLMDAVAADFESPVLGRLRPRE